MSLSDSLVEKLRKEQFEVNRFLTTNLLDDSLEPVKQMAERKLLALTGPALDVLSDNLDSTDQDVKHRAAIAILDRSPATKPTSLQVPTEHSLPPEALKILMEGMGKMFGSLLDHQPTTLKFAEHPETTLVPKRKPKK